MITTAGQRDQENLAAFHLDAGRRAFEREADREAIQELRRALYLSPYLAEAHLLLGRAVSARRPSGRGGRGAEDRAVERGDGAAHVGLAEALPAGPGSGRGARRDRSRAGARPEVGRGAGPEGEAGRRRGKILLSSALMASTHDDAFREIQLSGKQLVFLFMAVVVILVGDVPDGRAGRPRRARGPRDRRAPTAAAEAEPSRRRRRRPRARHVDLAGDRGRKTQLRRAARVGRTREGAAEGRTRAPAPAADAADAEGRTAPPAGSRPPPAAPAAARRSAGRSRRRRNPPGTGFAIQVAALRERDEADMIVKRLAGKGYPAYVVAPARARRRCSACASASSRSAAKPTRVAARLQKEEQFKPWIVR